MDIIDEALYKLSSRPDSAQMENGLLHIQGTLLAPGKWNGLDYTEGDIANATLPTGMKITKLTKNHGEDIEDDIGVFTSFSADTEGIKYDAYIDEPKTIQYYNRRRDTLGKLDMPFENAFEISSELIAQKVFNSETKTYEAKGIKLKRASLVLDGACGPPNCTVNPITNSQIKNATICEQKYMTPDAQRYKKGWEGCLESKMNCMGMDKKRATNMCNYIFWRRHWDENFDIIKLLEDYDSAYDNEVFVTNLVDEMLTELKAQLTKGGIELTKEDVSELFGDFVKNTLGMEGTEGNPPIKSVNNEEAPAPEKKKDEEDKKKEEPQAQEVSDKQGDGEKTVPEGEKKKDEDKEEETKNSEEATELLKLKEELSEIKQGYIDELGDCKCLEEAGVTAEELKNWSLKQIKVLLGFQRSFKKKILENSAQRHTIHNSAKAEGDGISFENLF